MTVYLNAKCSICGKPYHLCNDCANTKSFTPWRTIADTVNCYKIFLTLRDYTNGYVSKDDIKKALKNCDLSELETFEENIKKSIKEILLEDKNKVTKTPKKRSIQNVSTAEGNTDTDSNEK